MLSSRHVRRQIVLYVVLLALSMLLLAFSGSAPVRELRRGVGFAMAPIQETLRGSARTIGSLFATIGEIERLRQQNEELTRRLNVVEAQSQGLASLRAQNELLTALLDVRSSLDYRTVAAEVISKRTTDQERVISLDRGTDAGIEEGDPVIGPGGALIGQVAEVGPNFSRVLLISDTRVNVAGLIESSRAVGLISGQLERPLQMVNIPAELSVTLGESVVTAGIELAEGIRSPYPKGLLIGIIVDVQRSPDQLFQTALVRPVADLERLEYVLVITDYEGGLPDLSPSPTP
ncbi:MAG TPA: rod shape-determining protein MreC [Candidatus Limnocylindrales bacterium]|nr:rod shape-determining protein MreC [Candidatus Limnocylindrales bacterium]